MLEVNIPVTPSSPLEILDGDHSVSCLIQLVEGLCNDLLARFTHGGLKGRMSQSHLQTLAFVACSANTWDRSYRMCEHDVRWTPGGVALSSFNSEMPNLQMSTRC